MIWSFEDSWASLRRSPESISPRGPLRLIAGRWADPSALSLTSWLWQGRPSPLVLDGFFESGFAVRFHQEVARLASWERQTRVFLGADETIDVDERESRESPAGVAFPGQGPATQRHDYYPDLAAEIDPHSARAVDTRSLRQFIAACVVGSELRDWLSDALAVKVGDRSSFELVRYRPGDQIQPHQDLIPGRVFAVLWYVDPDTARGEGSDLRVTGPGGESWLVEPVFNRLVVIPIRTDYWHEVTERTSQRTGRQTASVGIYAPGF